VAHPCGGELLFRALVGGAHHLLARVDADHFAPLRREFSDRDRIDSGAAAGVQYVRAFRDVEQFVSQFLQLLKERSGVLQIPDVDVLFESVHALSSSVDHNVQA